MKKTASVSSNYFEVVIDETARNTPKDESRYFNSFTEKFKSFEEVKEYIIDRYGKIPKGKNKIYQDNAVDSKGNNVQVGFMYSFWNKDISHNSKKWYQTDWIVVKEIQRKATFIKL